jgi:ATP synthase, H+ transporting, mitochondrial F0 complex, subunit s
LTPFLLVFRVDKSRIKEVGPDRACAEWLLRCGGSAIRWKNGKSFISDYNALQVAAPAQKIVEIHAIESSISDVGFPYLSKIDLNIKA